MLLRKMQPASEVAAGGGGHSFDPTTANALNLTELLEKVDVDYLARCIWACSSKRRQTIRRAATFSLEERKEKQRIIGHIVWKKYWNSVSEADREKIRAQARRAAKIRWAKNNKNRASRTSDSGSERVQDS